MKTKKMLQKEMCQNKMVNLELDNFKKENKELKVKNDTIMNLHRTYEEKWEKISHNYKFFKEFYRNCLLKAFQIGLSKGFLDFFHFYFPETSLEKLYENHDNFQKFLDPSKLNNDENFDVPLIDLEVSEVFECNPLEYETECMDSSISKEKYLKYLLKLSNDLSMSYRKPPEELKNVEYSGNMSPKQYLALPLKGRLKRSLSNTLEFITSNKKHEFNKLFMFYNQEIIDFVKFKRLMQAKNQQLMMDNQYGYQNNNFNGEGENQQQSAEFNAPNGGENNNNENYE